MRRPLTHELRGAKLFDSSLVRTPQDALDFIGNILESSTEHSIIGTDLNGQIQLWNEGARRRYGYEPEDVIGSANLEILHIPEDVRSGKSLEIIDTVLAVGKWSGTLQWMDRHGRRFTTLVAVTPRYDVQGHNIGFLLISKDNTEEARLIDVLKTTQFYTRSLIESNIDALMTTDPSGIITDVNHQMQLLTGYDRESLIGSAFKNYFTDPKAADDGILRVLREGKVTNYELTALARDGTETVVWYNASLFNDQNGILQGVFASARDVTERLRAESHFRGLLESAPDSMVIVNREGLIYLVNSQTERLFGYQRSELLGQHVEILIPHRHQFNHSMHRQDYFQNPRPRRMGEGQELFGMRKDGTEFPIEIILSPLETKDGFLVSSSIRDITEHKRIERALQEKNIELERANQAKDRFLASMSHELRTPLNAVIGFTGTLLMKLPGPLNDVQEDQLETIDRSANQLLSLINDLLDLAKIESGNVELNLVPVPCQSVIDEVISALMPMAVRKRLGLSCLISDRALLVRTDRRALSQILLNLTTNALKFTDRGTVHINLNQFEDESGLNTRISVSDTGIGIHLEDQNRLFQAFQQVQEISRAVQQGTGLGLHLSQKLAHLLGGHIDFVSEPGEGSTFTLEIKERRNAGEDPADRR